MPCRVDADPEKKVRKFWESHGILHVGILDLGSLSIVRVEYQPIQVRGGTNLIIVGSTNLGLERACRHV